jgi:hypothetical protein
VAKPAPVDVGDHVCRLVRPHDFRRTARAYLFDGALPGDEVMVLPVELAP